MNGMLLKLLLPRLLEFQGHDNVPAAFLSASLLAPSRKCWLAEVGKNFCSECEGDWRSPEDGAGEIMNGRWEKSTAPNSRFGQQAPFLEKLRVMGGFVNEAGCEHVPERKRLRAEEIHEFGWS